MFNQFTETFNILDLARKVKAQAEQLGLKVEIAHLKNPRVEKEAHYYNAAHTKLLALGLEPHLLSEELLHNMVRHVQTHAHRIKPDIILPRVKWDGQTNYE